MKFRKINDRECETLSHIESNFTFHDSVFDGGPIDEDQSGNEIFIRKIFLNSMKRNNRPALKKTRRFAWYPKRLHDGSWVFLQSYVRNSF